MTSALQRFEDRIVDEHIDELRFLLHLRAARLPLGRGGLQEWLGFDRRVAAHIDGLLLRAARVWPLLVPAARSKPTASTLRLAGVVALNSGAEALADRWLALASAEAASPPTADEIVRWISPEQVAPLLSLVMDGGLGSDLALALAFELAGRLRPAAEVWDSLAAKASAHPAQRFLTAHAVARIAAPEAASALIHLRLHPEPVVRNAARCAAPAEIDPGPSGYAELPLLSDAAAFGPSAMVRVALQLPPQGTAEQIQTLASRGEWLACACAVAALGDARGLAVLQAPAAAAGAESPVALLALAVEGLADGSAEPRPAAAGEALLLGRPRDTANCMSNLRDGESFARLICAEVLRATLPGFQAIDILAPAWQQLSHPALSKATSTAPEPAASAF